MRTYLWCGGALWLLVILQLAACSGCDGVSEVSSEPGDTTKHSEHTEEDSPEEVVEEHHDNGMLRSRTIFGPDGRILLSAFWDDDGDMMAERNGPYLVVENFAAMAKDELDTAVFAEAPNGLTGGYFKGSPFVDDSHLEALASWQDLRWVNLKDCGGVSSEAIDSLLHNRPDIQVLR
jgi:hypothetical protein